MADYSPVWFLSEPSGSDGRSQKIRIPISLRRLDVAPQPRWAFFPSAPCGTLGRIAILWPARAVLNSCEFGWFESAEAESRRFETRRFQPIQSTDRGRLFAGGWASCEVRPEIRHSGPAFCLRCAHCWAREYVRTNPMAKVVVVDKEAPFGDKFFAVESGPFERVGKNCRPVAVCVEKGGELGKTPPSE